MLAKVREKDERWWLVTGGDVKIIARPGVSYKVIEIRNTFTAIQNVANYEILDKYASDTAQLLQYIR